MISTFKAQHSYTSFKLSENIPYMETLNQNIPLMQVVSETKQGCRSI